MTSKALLQEAAELKAVCQRLEIIADRNPIFATQIMAVCDSITTNALIIEVLVATNPGVDPVN